MFARAATLVVSLGDLRNDGNYACLIIRVPSCMFADGNYVRARMFAGGVPVRRRRLHYRRARALRDTRGHVGAIRLHLQVSPHIAEIEPR